MPRDSSGNTPPLPGTIVSTGDTILPSQHNPFVNDVYAMITQSLSRDGQGGMRSNLDMSGFRITNLGSPTLDTDVSTLGQVKDAMPVGAVVDFAGSTAPSKWALCFGQAISRAGNPDLFAAIGTTYGAGDGSTTFNIPDLRGRVTAGKDDMGGTSSTRLSAFWSALSTTLGGVFGTASHILTTGQMPSHTHNVSGTTSSSGEHSHEMLGRSGSDTFGPYVGGSSTNAETKTTQTSGVHSHTVSGTAEASGSGEQHTNTQPTMIVNKIIKVSY